MAFGGDFLKSIIEQQKKKQQGAPRPQIAPEQQLPVAPATTAAPVIAPTETPVAPVAPVAPVSAVPADIPVAPVAPEVKETAEIQNLLQNAEQLKSEVNPAEGQNLVKNVLTQSLGESVSNEEVSSAIPLMQELMSELGQQKADIKSELAKKVDLGQPEKLSKGEKIAVGLLMILPAIVGAMTGRGGAGLAATGKGIIELEKLKQGQEDDFKQSQKDEQVRLKGLRSELLGITKSQISLAQAQDKILASKEEDKEDTDFIVHEDFKTKNLKLLKNISKKEFQKFREKTTAAETLSPLYEEVFQEITGWDSEDKIRAIAGDPNKSASLQRTMTEILLKEKDFFDLGALQEGELKLMKKFIGDPTQTKNLLAKKSVLLDLVKARMKTINRDVNINAKNLGLERVSKPQVLDEKSKTTKSSEKSAWSLEELLKEAEARKSKGDK